MSVRVGWNGICAVVKVGWVGGFLGVKVGWVGGCLGVEVYSSEVQRLRLVWDSI